MKKFTENIDEKVKQYAGSQKVYNDIYNLIEETLTAQSDGEVSEKVALIGKDALVKELYKLVENEITRSKIKVYETFKSQPNMIKEDVEKKDELLELVNESLTQEVTYSNPLNEYYLRGGNYEDGTPHGETIVDDLENRIIDAIKTLEDESGSTLQQMLDHDMVSTYEEIEEIVGTKIGVRDLIQKQIKK